MGEDADGKERKMPDANAAVYVKLAILDTLLYMLFFFCLITFMQCSLEKILLSFIIIVMFVHAITCEQTDQFTTIILRNNILYGYSKAI